MSGQTLYVLYNADASVMGKLRYGYRKITCPKEGESECAACDITHGGLSLKETPAWAAAKKEIQDTSGMKVVQWHRDELSPEVKAHITKQNISYPVAMLERDGNFEVVMDKAELGRCNGNAQAFVDQLRTKGVISKPNL